MGFSPAEVFNVEWSDGVKVPNFMTYFESFMEDR